ncbi:hypothetical protein D3C72_1758410 [compost metagenome]
MRCAGIRIPESVVAKGAGRAYRRRDLGRGVNGCRPLLSGHRRRIFRTRGREGGFSPHGPGGRDHRRAGHPGQLRYGGGQPQPGLDDRACKRSLRRTGREGPRRGRHPVRTGPGQRHCGAAGGGAAPHGRRARAGRGRAQGKHDRGADGHPPADHRAGGRREVHPGGKIVRHRAVCIRHDPARR